MIPSPMKTLTRLLPQCSLRGLALALVLVLVLALALSLSARAGALSLALNPRGQERAIERSRRLVALSALALSALASVNGSARSSGRGAREHAQSLCRDLGEAANPWRRPENVAMLVANFAARIGAGVLATNAKIQAWGDPRRGGA